MFIKHQAYCPNINFENTTKNFAFIRNVVVYKTITILKLNLNFDSHISHTSD